MHTSEALTLNVKCAHIGLALAVAVAAMTLRTGLWTGCPSAASTVVTQWNLMISPLSSLWGTDDAGSQSPINKLPVRLPVYLFAKCQCEFKRMILTVPIWRTTSSNRRKKGTPKLTTKRFFLFLLLGCDTELLFAVAHFSNIVCVFWCLETIFASNQGCVTSAPVNNFPLLPSTWPFWTSGLSSCQVASTWAAGQTSCSQAHARALIGKRMQTKHAHPSS